MVQLVRGGASQRSAARQFGVSLNTVQRWLKRAGDAPLEQVDWADQTPGASESPRRCDARLEDRVLTIRNRLKEESSLGEYGAQAIHQEMQRRGLKRIPSVRTIGRILQRRGALDGRRRVRRQAPPPGWYLADLAARRVELDSFDIVAGLVIEGGQDVVVLNGMSLFGGLCCSWPEATITAKFTVEALLEHWREWGLPAYAKFDNDTVFQGAHQWPDSFGRVTRTCLSLGVTPVFAPPLQSGFQADMEAFNGRWQEKVWKRFRFTALSDVRRQSRRFVTAHRKKNGERIEDAPPRRVFPKAWTRSLQKPLAGQVVYVRKTNESGYVSVLGHTWEASTLWCHRLVRVDVDLTAHQLRIHALRRRDPTNHTLLATHEYHPPTKRFHE
jgi:putative transposase